MHELSLLTLLRKSWIDRSRNISFWCNLCLKPLFPTLLSLVSGWQEHRKAPVLNLYCVITQTHTHTHTRQTHPCWNKHNPPAPLSWVTLPKRNNNDRQWAGWRCVSVCVCFMRGHTHTHKHTNTFYCIPSLVISNCLGEGWRSEWPRRDQWCLWWGQRSSVVPVQKHLCSLDVFQQNGVNLGCSVNYSVIEILALVFSYMLYICN